MAITRFAHSANIRSLRSGRVLSRCNNEGLPPTRVRNASALSSPAWKRSKISSPGRHRLSSYRSLSRASVQGRVSSAAALGEDVDMGNDGDTAGNYLMQAPHRDHSHKSAGKDHLNSRVLQGGANSPASTLSMPPPMPPPITHHRSTMDAEEESLSPTLRREDRHEIINVREQALLPNLEDIGLPSDDIWDHDGVFGERCCYDHGETEYLLGTPNRWMTAASLSVSETVLEARLQKCEARPLKSTPAQCESHLYAHVQRVVRKVSRADETLYEIEWRRCWTRASHIPDNDWVVQYLERNLDQSLRRSTRLANTADERRMKNARITRVIQLDL